MKILLIDDSKVIREILKICINNAGQELAGEAGNGQVGLIKYKELNPDLVILDISMPEMDGHDCLKSILDYDKNAKVIICSSISHKPLISNTLQTGAIDYITKPFKQEDIVQKLKDLDINNG